MFSEAYSDVLEDEPMEARQSESELFAEAISMMQRSDDATSDKLLRIGTLHHINRLWHYLLKDVASEENQSSFEFKAGFISIGIFVLKHTAAMREDETLMFKPIVEVSEIVKEGLN